MSTAPARRLVPHPLGVLRTLALIALTAVLACAGAGVTAWLFHAPGSPARAELTYAGDTALNARLDDASDRLRAIADDVDRLANEARVALAEVTDPDPTNLQASLDRGSTVAEEIRTQTSTLRDALAALPGEGPAAALAYSNDTLYRRSAILAATDAAATLAVDWRSVTVRAGDAAKLTALISKHDQTVVQAAALGRRSKFLEAIATLDAARVVVDQVAALRTELIASTEDTVLDEWVTRSRDYDLALAGLYDALQKSHGKNTLQVQEAYRKERAAFAALPPDFRTIILIVAEVARGGLNQAVLSIEETRGRIDSALAEDASSSASPSPSASGDASPVPTANPSPSG